MTTSEYVGVREGAQRLGVSPRTIYRQIQRGRLPAVRVGRVLRVRWSDLTGGQA